VVNGKGLSTY
jgi:hypothetical protein